MRSSPPDVAEAPSARLTVLGGFGLALPDDVVYLPPTAQRLLALLAVHADAISRARAASLLWDRLPPRRAAAGLRSALWRVSHRGAHCLVRYDADRLALGPGVHVDLHSALGQARALSGPRDHEVPAEAPALLCRDLLPSWEDDWLTVAREHFHQSRLRALEELSRRQERAGRLGAAMECAMTALAADPLRETANRRVSEVHLAEGNVSEALRHYDLYRRTLRSRLGLAPSRGYRHLLAPYDSRVRPR